MLRFLSICFFGVVAFMLQPTFSDVAHHEPTMLGHAAAASTRISAKLSYKVYRIYRNKIYKRYRKSIRKRYSLPCRAERRLKEYKSWLRQLGEKVPGFSMRKRHKRYLRNRVRSYKRISKRRLRWSTRRCQRYWKGELKRTKKTLRSKCSGLLATDPKQAAKLWIGVRPWAHVYINGKLCGTAPLRANLNPGTYKIRLSFPPGRDEHKVQLQLSVAKKPVYLIHQMKGPPKGSKRDTGLLSQKQLNWSINKYKSQMSSCAIYQGDASKVLLSWKISAEGKPHTILWVSPLNPKPRFQKCILRAASRMRFPKIKGIARIDAHPILLQ